VLDQVEVRRRPRTLGFYFRFVSKNGAFPTRDVFANLLVAAHAA
jgi:hypothetical protein